MLLSIAMVLKLLLYNIFPPNTYVDRENPKKSLALSISKPLYLHTYSTRHTYQFALWIVHILNLCIIFLFRPSYLMHILCIENMSHIASISKYNRH